MNMFKYIWIKLIKNKSNHTNTSDNKDTPFPYRVLQEGLDKVDIMIRAMTVDTKDTTYNYLNKVKDTIYHGFAMKRININEYNTLTECYKILYAKYWDTVELINEKII